MLEFFFNNPNYFIFFSGSFFTIFLIRTALIKKLKYIITYHSVFFVILSALCVGGGGVINDEYDSLDLFTALEKADKLAQAKAHPKKYNSVLQADLLQFNSARELKDYIVQNEVRLIRTEAITMGWLFAFLTEISFIIIVVVKWLRNRFKIRKSISTKLNTIDKP